MTQVLGFRCWLFGSRGCHSRVRADSNAASAGKTLLTNHSVPSHYIRIMFLQRFIASVLLLAMTLVMAGAVMHAHEHGHEEETTRLVVSPLGDHEDGAAECSLCKVTKERVTVANAEVTFVVTYCVVQMRPLVQNLISDRCPQERTGRAPPRG